MEVIAAVIGIVGISFLLLYIVFSLDPEHFLLKLLLILFFLVAIGLIPKALIDEQDYCDYVKANQTVAGNVTTYQYARVCTTNSTNTYDILIEMTTWLWRLVFTYMLIYLTWYYLMKTGTIIKAKDPKGHKIIPYRFRK